MTGAALDQLRFLVAEGRLLSALEELNLLSECRFTGLFRFEGPDLHTLVLVDRDDPCATTIQPPPIDQAHWIFIQQPHVASPGAEARQDAHTADERARSRIRTYVGFPVPADDGLSSTVCHFDYDMVRVPPPVLELTRAFAASFEPNAVMTALQRALDRRLESLRLMRDEILLASATREEAIEAFEEYAQPLRSEAIRLLDGSASDRFLGAVAQLAASFGQLAPAHNTRRA